MQIFHGNYDSFDAACKDQTLQNSKVSENAFSSLRWKNRQREYLNQSKKGKFARDSSLPIFLTNHQEVNSILDIGGGSGWIFNLLGVGRDTGLTYLNFEISEMCLEFSKEFDHLSNVHFIDSWDSIFLREQIALVYSNSTMQYISDELFFEKLNKIRRPKYILFDDFIVTETKSYWALQNYYGYFIPYYFRNLEEFDMKLFQLGYSVKSLEDYRQNLTPGFIYGNEKIPQTIIYELDY